MQLVSWLLSVESLSSRLHSYVVVVEHDLSVLDYLSDYVCCLYGKPAAYGVVTMPFSVRSLLLSNNVTIVYLLRSKIISEMPPLHVLDVLCQVREGINIFLAGFVPTENLRFRDESLTFKVSENIVEEDKGDIIPTYTYPSMKKSFDNGFSLDVSAFVTCYELY